MRVLVVYCHPVPESFCAAVRDTVLAALGEAGHETRLIDLYAIGFDPVMGCEERRLYNETGNPHPMPEQAEQLKWAEAMVFVYPTWWYGLPAMLKGWLDRVWTPEITFAIAPDSGRIRPLMTHIRKLGVITTCGAPRWWSYMVGHPGKRTLTRGMRALFARRCRTVFLAHYLMDVSTPESRAAFLGRVRHAMLAF
ncbi:MULTISPECIES: NAD(P)H-dependent oxidoreductase [unclassified Roseitalea]|uniref:NAD(P)H-dependent oxidoreductase n=1 Tax=unclassified Roseitalea TaxID=2639107 RepID=UPI00273ED549|nr:MULTISPECIES: NAD(P)H-dependent oxidoreductase [unclassified Roseitalea]